MLVYVSVWNFGWENDCSLGVTDETNGLIDNVQLVVIITWNSETVTWSWATRLGVSKQQSTVTNVFECLLEFASETMFTIGMGAMRLMDCVNFQSFVICKWIIQLIILIRLTCRRKWKQTSRYTCVCFWVCFVCVWPFGWENVCNWNMRDRTNWLRLNIQLIVIIKWKAEMVI